MANNMYADTYVKTLSIQERKYDFKAKKMYEVEEWQNIFRQELEELLGINRIKSRGIVDLEPICIEVVKLADHIREEWRIISEPGYQVPFYVLRPLIQEGPLPLVITPHGHGKYGKDTYAGISLGEDDYNKMIGGERDIALQAVREGYISIALDQRAFGVTKFQNDIEADVVSSCRTMQMHALLFGRTLIGERVWDVSRIIDYAVKHLDINSECIAITGNSGGGTTSLFAAALDTRISIAVPASYFCTFEDSIGFIKHCECNYIPGIMELGEMYDIAGLIAPRPFLAVAGDKDDIFPIDAVKKAYEKLCRVYEVAGVRDRCELYIGDGGHRYYKARVWEFIKEWFCKQR